MSNDSVQQQNMLLGQVTDLKGFLKEEEFYRFLCTLIYRGGGFKQMGATAQM